MKITRELKQGVSKTLEFKEQLPKNTSIAKRYLLFPIQPVVNLLSG